MRPCFLLLFALICIAAHASTASAQDRGGFTLLATLGYGLQTNSSVEVGDNYTGDLRSYGGGTYSAYAGLNFGIGGTEIILFGFVLHHVFTNQAVQHCLPVGFIDGLDIGLLRLALAGGGAREGNRHAARAISRVRRRCAGRPLRCAARRAAVHG